MVRILDRHEERMYEVLDDTLYFMRALDEVTDMVHIQTKYLSKASSYLESQGVSIIDKYFFPLSNKVRLTLRRR